MKTLLLTLGLGLAAALQAREPLRSSALGEQDVAGRWYIKALAARTRISLEKVAPVTISLSGNGTVWVSSTHLKDGECHKVETALERTEEPGRYSLHGGLSSLRMEASAVRAHCMLSYEGRLGGVVFRVAKLLGRNPDPNPEAMQGFQEFTEREGLPRESIVTPEQAENCVPGRDEGEQPWK